jgi:hypothetical protein
MTRATWRTDHPRDAATRLPAQSRRPALVPRSHPAADIGDPVGRARSAGITAVWTGNYSGTVELSRLAGPRDGYVTATDALHVRPPGSPPWRLSDPGVRVAVYQHCLTRGTQFEIYRWVNLHDLARIWPELTLPQGVRDEWARVLSAAGLLPLN